MLHGLLICFMLLVTPLMALAHDSADLHMKPEKNSKIIGLINNTDVMIMLEHQGIWAKVVDVETGLVGWVVVPDEKEEA